MSEYTLKSLPGMLFICHHLCCVFKWILIKKDLKEQPKPSHLICGTSTALFFLLLNTMCHLGCQRGSWGAFSLFRTETFEQLIHQIIALPFSLSFGTCADAAWSVLCTWWSLGNFQVKPFRHGLEIPLGIRDVQGFDLIVILHVDMQKYKFQGYR